MGHINDLNKSVELQVTRPYRFPTVFSSSPSPSTLRARRTRMRRGMLRIPWFQTYWLTVVSITTFSVFMAFWANLRITSMARGAFLLKALYSLIRKLFRSESSSFQHLKTSTDNIHLVAGLVEVNGVVTSGRSHFLLLSVHCLENSTKF